jgi:hypothetical protein
LTQPDTQVIVTSSPVTITFFQNGGLPFHLFRQYYWMIQTDSATRLVAAHSVMMIFCPNFSAPIPSSSSPMLPPPIICHYYAVLTIRRSAFRLTSLMRFSSRLFGTKCNRCCESIPSNELVMRTAGHVYHINCFACVVCECRLEKGQEFALKDNKLYCKEHFTQLSNMNNIKQESKCKYLKGWVYFCFKLVA